MKSTVSQRRANDRRAAPSFLSAGKGSTPLYWNPSLGKVRMGYPTGKVRMGYPTGKVRMGYRWGRNKLLLQITISPHLASPEGEGQIHLTG